MDQVWLQVFTAMICGAIVKYFIVNSWIWVAVDFIVLGISYILLRRCSFINLKKSMMFLGGLTLINILVDINILDGLLGNLAALALVAWVMFGGKNNRGRRVTLRHKWHK
ncbi:MAG: hypothetical protein ABFC84_10795 [Veillonellales bacterium]